MSLARQNIIRITKNAILSFLVIFLLSIFVIVIGAYNYLHKPINANEDILFVVGNGYSISKTIVDLENKGIIQNKNWLDYFYLKIILKYQTTKNINYSFKAGEYLFEKNITTNQMLEKLSQGLVYTRRLVIPEGLTVKQVAEIINNNEFIEGDIDPDTLKEGSLMPNTYIYSTGMKAEDLIQKMQSDMTKAIDELWEKRKENLPIRNKEEALILASIVEKETGKTDERARVAAVFVNRLRLGMKLQTDPTVIYAATDGYGKMDRPIYKSDLALDSPYNTYKKYGLPPSPIANPGYNSIKAALNPIDSDELYFVADGKGGHSFSSNINQHNEYVKILRELEKQQRDLDNNTKKTK